MVTITPAGGPAMAISGEIDATKYIVVARSYVAAAFSLGRTAARYTMAARIPKTSGSTIHSVLLLSARRKSCDDRVAASITQYSGGINTTHSIRTLKKKKAPGNIVRKATQLLLASIYVIAGGDAGPPFVTVVCAHTKVTELILSPWERYLGSRIS